MALTPGTRLGAYEVLALLGNGGMGEVYRARDTRLDRIVAIKILHPDAAGDPDRRQRLDREARAIASLNHPHICTLYDVGHQDGIDYLVMELLEGQTLAERLTRGALPLDQAMQYAIQLADALAFAHRHGIVHRDLKPANVFIAHRESGGATVVKLLDFGIAKAMPLGPTAATAAATLTDHGTLLGTLQYMAPEQLEGRDADPRSDLFAFGAVLYEMVTGRRAFTRRQSGECHRGRARFGTASALRQPGADTACARAPREDVPGEEPRRSVAGRQRRQASARMDRGECPISGDGAHS